MGETETVEIPKGSAAVSFHFNDADPVAVCAVDRCRWHGHGDSAADAFSAWWKHRHAEHPERMS